MENTLSSFPFAETCQIVISARLQISICTTTKKLAKKKESSRVVAHSIHNTSLEPHENASNQNCLTYTIYFLRIFFFRRPRSAGKINCNKSKTQAPIINYRKICHIVKFRAIQFILIVSLFACILQFPVSIIIHSSEHSAGVFFLLSLLSIIVVVRSIDRRDVCE